MNQNECPVEAALVAWENKILDDMAAEIAAKTKSTKPLCRESTSHIQEWRALISPSETE